MSLELELVSLGNRVEGALGKCRLYLRSELEMTAGGMLVFKDQPDDGPPYLGTYGASCAALALLAAGADRGDPLVRDLLKYLCDHQMEGGGWTIRNAKDVGLTTACAFSLMALGEAGVESEQEKKAVSLGVEWLVRNATKRGWPFYEGGAESGIAPTALAVRALRRVRSQLSPAGLQVFQHGCSRVEQAFREDGAIPGRAEGTASGSRAATSVALVTLVECDYRTWADPILRGMEWLKQQAEWQDDNSDSFHYHGKRQGAAPVEMVSGHVNYVHFTSALMLQALLACEVEITEPGVRQLTEHVVGRQRTAGDWRSDLAPRETPTWMEMDAALALSRFSKALAGVRPTLKFRGELIRLDSQAGDVMERMTTMSTEIQTRMKGIETLITAHQDALVAIDRIIKFAGAVLPFLPVCAIVGGYIYLRARIPASNWVTDVIAVLVSALSLLPPIFKARRRRTASPVITVTAIGSGQAVVIAGEGSAMELRKGPGIK